jgi:hypothetical protein
MVYYHVGSPQDTGDKINKKKEAIIMLAKLAIKLYQITNFIRIPILRKTICIIIFTLVFCLVAIGAIVWVLHSILVILIIWNTIEIAEEYIVKISMTFGVIMMFLLPVWINIFDRFCNNLDKVFEEDIFK